MFRCLIISSVLLVSLMFASVTIAAKTENNGPQIIKLKMGKETIEFTHRKHQKFVNNRCWECHKKESGKIENWGETTAHNLCIPCHDLSEKGPVKCKGCHKK